MLSILRGFKKMLQLKKLNLPKNLNFYEISYSQYKNTLLIFKIEQVLLKANPYL